MSRQTTHRYTVARHRVLQEAAERRRILPGNNTHYHLRRLKWLEWAPDRYGNLTAFERLTDEGRKVLEHWNYEYGTDATRTASNGELVTHLRDTFPMAAEFGPITTEHRRSILEAANRLDEIDFVIALGGDPYRVITSIKDILRRPFSAESEHGKP